MWGDFARGVVRLKDRRQFAVVVSRHLLESIFRRLGAKFDSFLYFAYADNQMYFLNESTDLF
ncbi:hypothetical protein ADIS_2288 [Lunatimonas lonarensis]|uniref:Uncharacterized protein n=1 Tax=Lunatimonas lonarensis TaxID=1232681 RepID=R7ZT49_9BACT|nr:hypothetical protein ADIS_2288 [Lunatimonas lonarensis]